MAKGGLFTGKEIIEMAIQSEQNGYAFYEKAADQARTEHTKRLFEWLADQERHHEETFRSMLTDEKEHRPPEGYEGQKETFVQALLETHVLPDAQTGVAALANMSSDLEAIQFALGFEKDTIIFMYEMRNTVPENQGTAVDALIAEEKSHVVRLNEIRTTLV